MARLRWSLLSSRILVLFSTLSKIKDEPDAVGITPRQSKLNGAGKLTALGTSEIGLPLACVTRVEFAVVLESGLLAIAAMRCRLTYHLLDLPYSDIL